jgi:hypothetical protein
MSSFLIYLSMAVFQLTLLTDSETGRNFADGNLASTLQMFPTEHICNQFCTFFDLQDLQVSVGMPSAARAAPHNASLHSWAHTKQARKPKSKIFHSIPESSGSTPRVTVVGGNDSDMELATQFGAAT